MVSSWTNSDAPVDQLEVAKRLIDVCLVSVLLDAGAGNSWAFREPGSDLVIGRSEGLAVASLLAFQEGAFSGQQDKPFRVDGGEPFTYHTVLLTTFHSKRLGIFHCCTICFHIPD